MERKKFGQVQSDYPKSSNCEKAESKHREIKRHQRRCCTEKRNDCDPGTCTKHRIDCPPGDTRGQTDQDQRQSESKYRTGVSCHECDTRLSREFRVAGAREKVPKQCRKEDRRP